MTSLHVLKLPNLDEYMVIRNIALFRLAPSTKEHKGHRVFIDINIGGETVCRWVKFKTKKSAQNFCATLAKAIEKALHHAK